jgi:hypothetical protein
MKPLMNRRPHANDDEQEGEEDDVTPVLLQLPTDQRVSKMLRAMFVAVFDSCDKSNDAELLFVSVKLLSRSRCWKEFLKSLFYPFVDPFR